MYDNNGILHEGDEVADQFVKHFEEFLGKEYNVEDLDSLNLFSNKLSDAAAENMVRDVTEDEIKKAMFDIDDGKAPGPLMVSLLLFSRKLGEL